MVCYLSSKKRILQKFTEFHKKGNYKSSVEKFGVYLVNTGSTNTIVVFV